MYFFRIESLTKITVEDHKSLLYAWKRFGGDMLIGAFIVEKPLTDAQMRRLPKALKEKLSYSSDGDVEWLRDLWSLPDTRCIGPISVSPSESDAS